MQHLNTLTELVNAVSTVAELARASQTYRFNVGSATTFYLHAEQAEIRLQRHAAPQIEISAQLQAPFAWRIGSDQDDVGVYFVARRRPVVGAMAGAVLTVIVPDDCYLVLKLVSCRLSLDGINGTVEIPASGSAIVMR
jgi:hypothetical protein